MRPLFDSVASLAMWSKLVGSTHEAELALRSSLGVKDGHLVTHHTEVGGSPSDRDRVSSPHESSAGLDGLYCEAVSGDSQSEMIRYIASGAGEDSDPESVGLGISRC